MQKRNSKSNINGKIIMMQNDLMNKLAVLQQPQKQCTDQLGFPARSTQFDSLTNLLSKAKEVTTMNKDKIQVAKKSSITAAVKKEKLSKRKSDAGTFLTGIGLASEPIEKPEPEDEQTKIIHRQYYSHSIEYEQEDPDEMIKDMIKRSQQDDLAQLRRMIKETDSSLQDYGKQLLRTRKEVLGMADRYCDIDYKVVDKIQRYKDNGY